MVKHRLADNKIQHGTCEALTLHVPGQFTGLENYLLLIERDDPSLRHNNFLRSFLFDLNHTLRLFELNGTTWILDPNRFYKLASKASLPFLDSRSRKKLLLDCRNLNTQTRSRVLAVITTLTKAYSFEFLLGYHFQGIHTVHFISDPARMTHIFGLSDAVDLAMSNFGMTVRFPVIKTVKVDHRKVHFSFRSRKMHLPAREGELGTRVFASRKRVSTFGVEFRMTRKSSSTKRRRFDLIIHYLRVFPKNLQEKDYVKLIKLSLAGLFSEQMSQELPKGYPMNAVPIFPSLTQQKLNIMLKNKKRRVQFYFNLLQSKSLCAPVGQDMIDEAYHKHRLSLCRPKEDVVVVPPEMLSELREYGRKVGKRVNELYSPYETTLPNTRSSIEATRLEGGNKGALEKDGTLSQFEGHPLLHMMSNTSNSRMEPYVIGLFGPPASGKSTFVQTLVRCLQKEICPELSREDTVYSRSCSSKHWDGYYNQPIVVLDDFGQNLSDRTDLAEFMTLVSLNDYVLPMADLSEKGKLFRSPIIIVTSNIQYGCSIVTNGNGGLVLEDPNALWRRFDLPLLVHKVNGNTQFSHYLRPSTLRKGAVESFYEKKFGTFCSHLTQAVRFSGTSVSSPKNLGERTFAGEIIRTIINDLQKKWDFHSRTFHDSWFQLVHSLKVDYRKNRDGVFWDPLIVDTKFADAKTSTIGMDFPISPPKTPPVVKAHAIAEPLKVRMITIGEKDTKVLQPFQKALWTYLGEQPQFCLTNGVKTLEDFENETLPWIHRIEECIRRIDSQADDDDYWLSGDYTAATDNFPMSVTRELMEGILEEIDHEPTREWVRWEISSHEIRYPHGESGVQTSGQLMGSLLSFPLLCFLNDYAVSSSGFKTGSYLVNGDDVVAKGSMKSIFTWKDRSPQVGLSLSVGKNFIDKDFCTVNSQLFYQAEVLHTGKVSTQTRSGTTLGYCFAEAQFYWGSSESMKENFLLRNLPELKRTPRSLHFSKAHGGLGLVDTQHEFHNRVDTRLAKEVFIRDWLAPFAKVHPVPGAPFSFVCFPMIRGDSVKKLQKNEDFNYDQKAFNRFMSLDLNRPEPEGFDDLTHKQFRKEREMFLDNQPQLVGDLYRHLTREGAFDLEQAPELGTIECEYRAVTNGIARKFSNSSQAVALQFLSDLWENQEDIHPFEYIDFDDCVNQNLIEVLEECERLNLDIVQLFEEPSSWIEPDGSRIREDVIKFWNSVQPESLESGMGGKVFQPRPQSFETVEEFFELFGVKTKENY